MIIYENQKLNNKQNLIDDIAKTCNVSKKTASLLVMRKVNSTQEAEIFLNPSKKYFYSPFLFNNMKNVVERITKAKINNERVLIFGDYDADGICATSILYYSLKEFGIDADYIIPERDNGYGLNLDLIKEKNNQNKIDLIITVDCGISDSDKIEEIKKLNIDVIVTDHHEEPEILPNVLIINPKVKNSGYPYSSLCGAGVSYKVSYALIGEKADKYLDFVALATIADSMDLIDENRHIVAEGLKLYNNGKLRKCFAGLIDESKVVTAQTLTYNISPRVNAGGRLGDAMCALKLFLSTDENEIFDLTAKLNSYNIARQQECENIYKQAKSIINQNKYYKDDVILVANNEWKTGFVGIVAAKLTEDYSKPTIVFAGQNGMLKGSARSIDGVNIFELISSCKDILGGFGGHAQAAGVSVSEENFEQFRTLINKAFRDRDYKLSNTFDTVVDMKIEDEFPLDFAREIDLLEPFGVGNKRPTFAVEANALLVKNIKNNQAHISFNTDFIEMLYFNGIESSEILSLPIKKYILFESNLSTFKGKEYLKGYVKKVILDQENNKNLPLVVFEKQLEMLKNSKNNKLLKYDNNLEYGKIYAVNNIDEIPENLKNIPISLFKSNAKGKESLIICPTEISENTSEIIYIKRPLATVDTIKPCFVVDNNYYFNFDYIDTDRSEIAKYFEKINGSIGENFSNITDLYLKNKPCENAYMYIFTLSIMLELGIFKIENGKLKRDLVVKRQLNESIIYKKMQEMKENIC